MTSLAYRNKLLQGSPPLIDNWRRASGKLYLREGRSSWLDCKNLALEFDSVIHFHRTASQTLPSSGLGHRGRGEA